jgi:hypothetical protein
MKRLLLGFIVLGLGCISEYTVPEGANPYKDESYYSTADAIRNLPYFSRDDLPNSNLQIKAYQSSLRDVNQFGHFCGGFFFGLPYTVSAYFFSSNPPHYDFQGMPPDSVYWYSRYYSQEVNHIRSTNAWMGTLTRWSLGLAIGIIIAISPQGEIK